MAKVRRKKKRSKPKSASRRTVRQLTIEAPFAVDDYREIRDPFVGWVWRIARLGYWPYQEYLKRSQSSSPLYSGMKQAMVTSQMTRSLAPDEEISEAELIREWLTGLDWDEIDTDDTATQEGIARHLVGTVRSDEKSAQPLGYLAMECGECGHTWEDPHVKKCPECGARWSGARQFVPLQYSPEVGLDVLGSTSPVPGSRAREIFPEDDYDADQEVPLGLLVQRWILGEAAETEAYRTGHLEEALGKSAPPSDGG